MVHFGENADQNELRGEFQFTSIRIAHRSPRPRPNHGLRIKTTPTFETVRPMYDNLPNNIVDNRYKPAIFVVIRLCS